MDEVLKYNKDDSEDFYSILGCDQSSTEEQICAEYKARVIDCHPDKNPHDPTAVERFSKLQRAKDVLSDRNKRSSYDRWRRSELCVSYNQWCDMGALQMSMHWANSKPQSMISDSDSHGQDDTCTDTTASQISLQDTVGKQRLKTATTINLHCFKDSSSELVQKFRNYEI